MDFGVNWEPGIGDPTVMGWVTVLAYVVAAGLAAAAARALDRVADPDARGRQPEIWRLTTILLVALAINKELDLQSWFTAFARVVLKKQGWMEYHRILQFRFIVGLICVSLIFLIASAWCTRRRRREYWLLLLGETFTVTFIVLRAASFHHVDVLLGTHIVGVKVNWALELTGIGVIALAAWTRRRSAP